MRITPLDVRKQEFRRVVRGLDAEEVYAFLATVADEYETVLTDNKQLRDRVLELDEKVNEYRNMEKTLRDTLLTAERVMAEARENARKEGELIVRDARGHAEHEIAAIAAQMQSLKAQVRELRNQRDGFLARLRGLAEAQLGLVDSYARDFRDDDGREANPAAPAPHPAQAQHYAQHNPQSGAHPNVTGQSGRGQAGYQPPAQPATAYPPPAQQATAYPPPAADPGYGPPSQAATPQYYTPAPAQPVQPAAPDRWRDYEAGREAGRSEAQRGDSGRVQRLAHSEPRVAIAQAPQAPLQSASRPSQRVMLRVETETVAAAPAPPNPPVDTRVDALPEARLYFDEQTEQVADAVVSVAADMAQAAQLTFEPDHDVDDPWAMLSPSGQPRETVAPYAADPQGPAAPAAQAAAQAEAAQAEEGQRRASTGWSRWAIDKFSKALGDH